MRRRFACLVLAAGLAASLSCGGPSRPDVVLITIDTLRADRVGCYGHDAARTPTLDALAAQGVRYDQCFSPAPVTLPSHASILTGQWPPRHGVRNNLTYQLPDGVPTLAEALGREGFRTGAFVGAFPLDARFGLGRGFDHYDDALPGAGASLLNLQHRERPAAAVVRAALDWVGEQSTGEPVFVWLHFYEPHAPYQPPRDYKGPDPYDGEVFAADRAVDSFLTGLDQLRPGARLTVVTSDHGEGLGEHDEDTHAFFLYETTQRVPLILHGPTLLPTPRVVSEPVTLCDVAPTVLALLGVESPLDPDGVDVSTDVPRRPLYAETIYGMEGFGWSPMFAMRRGARKVIRSRIARAFDLSTDPAEMRDLTMASWASDALDELDRWVTQLNQSVPSDAARQPTTDERAALESLGYTGGTTGAADVLLQATTELPDASARVQEHRATTRAQDLIQAGDLKEAIDILEGVLAQGPENVWVHAILASAYVNSNRLDDALRHYELSALHSPRRLEPQLNLARVKREMGDLAGALTHLRRAAELDPEDLEVLNQTVRAFTVAGRGREALELLDERLVSATGAAAATLWGLRARVCISLRDASAAATAAQRAVELDPSVENQQILALVQRGRGDWSAVLSTLAAAGHDRDSTSLEMRGDAYERLGRLEDAVAAYQAALGVDRNQSHALQRVAWLMATSLGRASDALPFARRALELRSSDPEAYHVYFEVLDRMGRTEELREQLAAVRGRFPAHAGIQERATRLGIE